MATQYVFGTFKDRDHGGEERETLHTTGSVELRLQAGVYHSVTLESACDIVTHRFKVDRCLAREINREGLHSAVYAVSEHSMSVDGSPTAMRLARQAAANLDYLSMMVDVALPNEGV